MIVNTGPVNTRQSTIPFSVPAPVGGLNGREPLAAMPPTDAYLMDNMYPNTATVESRMGYVAYSDATLAGPVQSLVVYTGADGDKMLACGGGSIYDVSTPTPSLLLAGQTSNVFDTAMFSNAADNAQHLIMVNGEDDPLHYTGAALSALAITGVDGGQDKLTAVLAFKSRLYFAHNERLGFYYLGVGAIQGAASFFDLAQVSKKGGKLVAIASYSGGGETPQDNIVFITSKGECIVYQGFDPSNAASWTLVGRYFSAPPMGRNCTFNYNGELIIITLEGALPFSTIRKNGDSEGGGVIGSAQGAITGKLGKFLSELNTYSDVPGWAGIQYPRGGWLLINAPATPAISGQYYHYVMNTTTGAWCRFTNMNGMSWAVYNGRLYFGDYEGNVYLADEGRTDNGSDILCDVKQAYNYFGDERGAGPLIKHFQWASLIVACDGTPPLSGKFNVDFTEDQPDYLNSLAEGAGASWDTADWDVAEWAFDAYTQRFVITLNKGGFAGALWLRATLGGITFKWYNTQYTMQKTQGLLI